MKQQSALTHQEVLSWHMLQEKTTLVTMNVAIIMPSEVHFDTYNFTVNRIFFVNSNSTVLHHMTLPATHIHLGGMKQLVIMHLSQRCNTLIPVT